MQEYISKLLNERNTIKKNFSALFDNNTPIVPIPFFGNISTAKIITIGANPSATELRNNGWSENMEANQISEKLIHYFHNQPHQWFETWETALNTVGCSYYDDTAAHIDLCPWATKSLSSLDRLGLTENTIELFKQSVPFFVEGIKECTNLKFVLMAGTVTKKYWLNNFLYKFVNTTNFKILEKPYASRGGAFINKHKLIIDTKSVSAIFSSSSPSATGDKKNVLPKMIEENKNFIIEHL